MKNRSRLRHKTTLAGTLSALFLLSNMSGCALMVGATGGLNVLATPRGHTLLSGGVNTHVVVGSPTNASATQAFMVGSEFNFRATNDYGHLGFGLTGSYLFAQPSWAGYARVGFAPMSGSVRNGTLLYSWNTGVELGFILPIGQSQLEGTGYASDARGLLITLRGDMDFQVATGNAELFVSLNVGIARFAIAHSPQGPQPRVGTLRRQRTRVGTRENSGQLAPQLW